MQNISMAWYGIDIGVRETVYPETVYLVHVDRIFIHIVNMSRHLNRLAIVLSNALVHRPRVDVASNAGAYSTSLAVVMTSSTYIIHLCWHMYCPAVTQICPAQVVSRDCLVVPAVRHIS